MPRLDGQIVIVTGASAGIGEATARRLARDGATVVITARRQDRLDVLQKEIERGGGKALGIAGDVTSDEDRKHLVEQTMRTYGRIDALVNNAGYGMRGPIEIVPVDEIRRNFETNVFSLIALTQLVMPIMRKQGSGRIVNISSVAGKIARALSSVYDATKHALEAISDGMRGEMAPFGVKVIIIEPGFIITEFLQAANEASKDVKGSESAYSPFFGGFEEGTQRLRKMAGKPDDIARAVESALTSDNPRIRYAAPGHAKLLILLNRLLPARVIDAIVARQTGMTPDSLKAGPSVRHRAAEGH